jgi:hypothetical protein
MLGKKAEHSFGDHGVASSKEKRFYEGYYEF